MFLSTSTVKLQTVLGGAVTANALQYTVEFVDVAKASGTRSQYLVGGAQRSTSNDTTDVDVCDATSRTDVTRLITRCAFYNADTASATITVKKDDGGTESIQVKWTLLTGETLHYCGFIDGGGEFYATDVNGARKEVTVSIFSSITVTGLVDISATGAGQIKFPATQNASADANTLDDYEEGTWTPAITFATPGDLSVAYTTQVGRYTKIGRLVTLQFNMVTSTFTHTTASGILTITGLPFTAANISGLASTGALGWQGITKANYTDMVMRAIANTTTADVAGSGSGQAQAQISTGDMPTGGTVILQATLNYIV